jgi:hypothetical protein
MISALYVLADGPYSNIPGIDPWDIGRDARLYSGPFPVISHPPCERWGRYWGGGPSAKVRRILGDDGGCFEAALGSVRAFGGILEHPEASHAFKKFGLPRPKRSGGWTEPDEFGGRSCCVAQGAYGHRAQKLTWLYGVGIDFKELLWGLRPGLARLDAGFHSKEHRARAIKTGTLQRLSRRQRLETPVPFRDLLISLLKP